MNNSPPNNLIDIFYSNSRLNVDYQALEELNFLIDEKIIKFKKKEFNSIEEFHKIIERLIKKEIKVFDYQGGETRHMALKYLGEKFLLSENKKVKIENIFHNRYPDLISEDQEIIIECGDTDPNKVIEYFSLGVVKLYLIPYPDDESDHLKIYEFWCEPAELTEYKEFREKINHDKIKEIIKKRQY
ncbi:MAG: hypothetical protein NT116_01655 [Candidatus Parcubacteria bacterium]|nr:hypothetical protein [Candidatus Parcubacteria bacterium]